MVPIVCALCRTSKNAPLEILSNSVGSLTKKLGVKGHLSNPNLSVEGNNAVRTYFFAGQISNHKIPTTFKCNLIETKIVFMDFARKDKLSTTGS